MSQQRAMGAGYEFRPQPRLARMDRKRVTLAPGSGVYGDNARDSGVYVEDAQLILASREDPAAFRLLYDRWAGRVLSYLYARVRDPEIAADLLAETFAVAYERRHRFKDTGRPGGAWLYGIARKELARFF